MVKSQGQPSGSNLAPSVNLRISMGQMGRGFYTTMVILEQYLVIHESLDPPTFRRFNLVRDWDFPNLGTVVVIHNFTELHQFR